MSVALRSQGGPDAGPLLFRVLNPPKYPASQPFLLMTLGPAIAALPLLERAQGRVAGVLETFGRVPMFYYLLHIPAIHVAALIVWRAEQHRRSGLVRFSAVHVSVRGGDQWGLPLLYLVFAVVVFLLYFACR